MQKCFVDTNTVIKCRERKTKNKTCNQNADSLDHNGILRSVAHRSHPLVHHDACMSVDKDSEEEEDDGRNDHHSQ